MSTALRRAGVAAVVLAVVAVAVVGLVLAARPGHTPTVRERVDAVAATLKCPTCGGLSVKDSTSVLAAGARTQIEQQLAEGRTPDQIRQYFVDRYGQQVLLDPGTSGSGLLVWLLPGLGVVAAGLLAWRWTRRHTALPEGDDDAATALAGYRAGRLVPDTSPAGDALSAALVARVAAEEDDEAGGPVLRQADARLGAAYRRYEARTLATPARAGRVASGQPGRRLPLPRPVVTVGALAVVAGAAVAGVLLTGSQGSGAPAAAASTAPASMPSPPPGYSGGTPQTPDQWVALGKAYDKAHQYPQAVAAYGMALKLDPGADAVTLMRADVLVRSGQAAQALPDLQRLATRYPDNPDVLLILGLAQHGTGSPDFTATLRRFLQLAPDSAAAPGVRSLLDKQ